MKEIVETHKNILISYQNIVLDALSNNDLNLFKRTNLAPKVFKLYNRKDVIAKSQRTKISKYSKLDNFRIRNLINIK